MISVLLWTLDGHAETLAAAHKDVTEIQSRVHSDQRDQISFTIGHADAATDARTDSSAKSYDIIQISARQRQVTGKRPGRKPRRTEQNSSDRIEQSLRDCLSRPLTQKAACVILEAVPEVSDLAAANSATGSTIFLPAGIDDASAISFLAAFYEAIAVQNSVQTSFWLGCCQIELEGIADRSLPRISSAAGFNPREAYLPIQPALALPELTPEQFFEQYAGLCNEIKETIAEAAVRKFCFLTASVHDGAGPVSSDQGRQLAWDFADLLIGLYRGSKALRLQRKFFERYRDPSSKYPNLYEWTINVEIGSADLQNWLRNKTLDLRRSIEDQWKPIYGDDFRQELLKFGRDQYVDEFMPRVMDFVNNSGLEFARRMRRIYDQPRQETAPSV